MASQKDSPRYARRRWQNLLATGLSVAAAGFGLGVGSFALWAAFGLPAPLVAAVALALGYAAVRRSGAGARGPGSLLARWALRLGTAHLIGWAAFVALLAALGTFAVSSLGV